MKLFIKNMCCNRCKLTVKSELEKLGFNTISVKLGVVTVEKKISIEEKAKINHAFQKFGLGLIDNKKSKTIEKIKTLIIELVRQDDRKLKTNLSEFLSVELHHNYHYLSNIFSEIEGKSIEQYFIGQKIERIKELLEHDELSLSEIAYRLNYSSVSHLSKQFKKIMGFTPSHFKQLKKTIRTPLENL